MARSAIARPVMAYHADRLMERRAPHFRAARSAAGHAHMTTPGRLGGRAFARIPAHGYRAWPPWVVQPTLERYARPDRLLSLRHANIQTCDRGSEKLRLGELRVLLTAWPLGWLSGCASAWSGRARRPATPGEQTDYSGDKSEPRHHHEPHVYRHRHHPPSRPSKQFIGPAGNAGLMPTLWCSYGDSSGA